MTFQTGHKKLGGRSKGTPNKRTEDLREALEVHGIDPVRELSQVLPELLPEKRADVMLSLMAFLFPKRKAAEASDVADIQTVAAEVQKMRLMPTSDLVKLARDAIAEAEELAP